MEEKTIYDDNFDANRETAQHSIRQTPVLVVLEGADLTNRYPITQPRIVIGRDVVCDISLTDARVSRRHGEFVYENFNQPDAEPRIALHDLGSSNGIRINGVKIEGSKTLCDRDRIQIGNTFLGFYLRDETTIKMEQRLVQMASSDGLTGLRNRAFFEMELEREYNRSRRYDRPLSLVMFDIDHFKNINDTYGHPAGDAALRELGGLMTSSSRSNDLSARFGGEEFAIILPETPLKSALIQAQRLRQNIENHPFNIGEKVLRITVSVGVAGMHPQMTSPQLLIQDADDALYISKRNGRNQVSWRDPEDGKVRPYTRPTETHA